MFQIEAELKITKKLFRLVYSGRHLEDGKHLSDYNMKDGHYVEVLGRLLSCTDCAEHNHGNIDALAGRHGRGAESDGRGHLRNDTGYRRCRGRTRRNRRSASASARCARCLRRSGVDEGEVALPVNG